MINLLLLAHGAFVLGFDYLPDRVTGAIAGALALGYAATVAAEWLSRRNLDLAPMLVPLAVILLCWAIAALHWQVEPTDFPPDFAHAARQASVFVCFLAFMSARGRISAPVLGVVVAALAVSALAHALLLPRVSLNGTLRLPPFSGGLHTSGYLMVAAVLAVLALWQGGAWSRARALLVLAVLGGLLLGGAVRTPLLGLLVFAAGAWLSHEGQSPRARLVLRLLGLYLAFSALVLLSVVEIRDFDQLSSGRIANYLERFDILGARSPVTGLFGTGPGTDLLRTETWWWDYKDSHSDLLKYLWESGVIGVLALLLWLAQIASYRRGRLFALALMLLVTSLVSNAFLTRPNAVFLLFAAQALALAMRERKGVEERPGSDPVQTRSARTARAEKETHAFPRP